MLETSVNSALKTGIPREDIHFAPIGAEAAAAFGRLFPDLTGNLAGTRSIPSHNDIAYADFGSDKFAQLGFYRYDAILRLSREKSLPVLYLDTDIVFIRDPRPFLALAMGAHPGCVIMQNDNAMVEGAPGMIRGIEPSSVADFNCCTGFAVWQPDSSHYRIITDLVKRGRSKRFLMRNQECFNRMKSRYSDRIYLLPQKLFPNGSVLQTEGLFPIVRNSMIFHANHVIGAGTKHKFMRLVEPACWEAPDISISSLARDPAMNAALNKPASQSSIASKDAAGGVNGDVFQEYGFETREEDNAWWMVDLEDSIELGYIVIVDRVNFEYRARTLEVAISEDGQSWTEVFQRDGSDELRIITKIAVSMTARFIRCRISEAAHFHLAQVIAVARENAALLDGF
jgi:hypothetical protein